MSEQELSEVERTLAGQLADFREGFSDDDFAYLMGEINDVRAARGREELDDLVDALITEMSDRSLKVDTESATGPDEQAISDWVRDVAATPDDEWTRIIAAAAV